VADAVEDIDCAVFSITDDSADELRDLGLERAGEFVEHMRAAHLDVVLRFLFRGQAVRLDHVGPEDPDGRRHRADLVVAVAARNFVGDVAAGQARHRGREVDDRLADTAADHHHEAGAGGRHRGEPQQRNQKAEARGRIGRGEDVLGVVVEGVTYPDDRPKTALRLRVKGVNVVLVFAADGAFLHHLQLLA
jgi:hypothetical protein